jgi:voltage-gated potassium channel
VYDILQGAETGGRAGGVVEAVILWLIALNIVMLTLETVRPLRDRFWRVFFAFEAASVAAFTAEYLLRLWSCTASPRYASPVLGRLRYALSPMALVDLLAILPFYVPKSGLDLRALRALRLTRVFRVAKVWRYSAALQTLGRVIVAKREQLLATLFTALLLVVVASTLMYFIEHEAQPDRFSSIPAAMWWGIATITTIGYGDVYPVTTAGKILAAVIAVLGIGLFALPTAILGAAFLEELQDRRKPNDAICPHCGRRIADPPAGTGA